MKRFCVIEENGGGLYLVIFRGQEETEVEYLHSGYEFCPGQLMEDLWALFCGDDPAKDWDGNEIESGIVMFHDIFLPAYWNYGWKIVADNDGAYPERMGAAAAKEISLTAILGNPKRFYKSTQEL